MIAFVNITILNNDHENVGGCVITDTNGTIIGEISSYYPNSNAIYAAYKTFQLAGQLCRRMGAYSTLIVRTNSFPMIKELNGDVTYNTTLFNQTKRYMKDFNYLATTFDANTNEYRRTMELAQKALNETRTFTKVYKNAV